MTVLIWAGTQQLNITRCNIVFFRDNYFSSREKVCSLFNLCINDERENASSTLSIIPETRDDNVHKSRIVDLGLSKPCESHDQVYGSWTAIEPSKEPTAPPVNILSQLEHLDEQESEPSSSSPRKRRGARSRKKRLRRRRKRAKVSE